MDITKPQPRLSLLLALIWCLLLLNPRPSMAWGRVGHEVMASLTYERLNPHAKAEVDRLLSLESHGTLANISNWADEHRDPITAKWHYVNLPRGTCQYDDERDCPGGQCVVRAIQNQIDVLKSRVPDADKLLALKYVVHLVQDIHQPLHAGHADDRGGNQYQLFAFMQGTNLHAFWDFGMIAQTSEDPFFWVSRLRSAMSASMESMPHPSLIAQESCKIVARPDFYPPNKLSAEYLGVFVPIMELQMLNGASRLASLLNKLWPAPDTLAPQVNTRNSN